MRCLAPITLLILAMTIAQPVAAQSFKPDFEAGVNAYERKDYATALRHFRPLAKQGHYGKGVAKDRAEAARWYRLAAKQGYRLAEILLATVEKRLCPERYRPPRSRQAKKAAQDFKPDYNAGYDAYKQKCYVTALRHWLPLAERGHAKAQFDLGLAYYKGLGFTRDYKEAVRWYRKAAVQGHARAQGWLGEMYRDGEGLLQDLAMAYVWLNISAIDGGSEAKHSNVGTYAGRASTPDSFTVRHRVPRQPYPQAPPSRPPAAVPITTSA